MSEGFSFPSLVQSTVSDQNPLLKRGTITHASHRSAGPKPLVDGKQQDAPMQPPKKKSGKVPLAPGYSQLDWMRLQSTCKDLAGLNGQKLRRDITLDEVKQHSSKDDAWTVLRGKVYNITAYLKFHPGGVPQLMRGAGKDCTALFNKYHAWVNSDMMLEKCLVGLLARSKAEDEGSSLASV